MKKTLYINNKKITANEFAWDTCHKIYLVNTPEDREMLLGYGYDLFPIDDLEEAWESSCGLRFISNGDLTDVVSQVYRKKVVFEYKKGK
jgi:hypothetical protein